MLYKKLLLLLLLLLSFEQILAFDKVVPLKNFLLEKRARNLSLELRCLVCQNESISSSNSKLAIDLKILIRKQIKKGKSDYEIKQFLVNRYGQFILFKPLFNKQTYFLWITPILFTILFSSFLYFYFKNIKKN